jgi:hypothetical protein
VRVLALAALSLQRIGTVNAAGDAIRSNWMSGVQAAGDIDDATSAYRDAQASLLMSTDADAIREYDKNTAVALKQLQGAKGVLAKLPNNAEEAGFIAEFTKAWQIYLDESKEMAALERKHDQAGAVEQFTGDSGYQFRKAKVFIAASPTRRSRAATTRWPNPTRSIALPCRW